MTKLNVQIVEEYRPLRLSFTNIPNLVVIPVIADGNCYFHAILRAFNTKYIEAKTQFDRVNIARNFRNLLADLLLEIDPLTGKDYYSGLNNGQLEDIAQGVKEYSKESLREELFSSRPVDNIYQELIGNAMNKDIYIIDGETNDMYNVGNAFKLYYKGRNSIVIYYTPGHFEVIGVRRSDGSVNTIFTPENQIVQACRDRLISRIYVPQSNAYITPAKSAVSEKRSKTPSKVTFDDNLMLSASSPKSLTLSPVRVTSLRAASPTKR